MLLVTAMRAVSELLHEDLCVFGEDGELAPVYLSQLIDYPGWSNTPFEDPGRCEYVAAM